MHKLSDILIIYWLNFSWNKMLSSERNHFSGRTALKSEFCFLHMNEWKLEVFWLQCSKRVLWRLHIFVARYNDWLFTGSFLCCSNFVDINKIHLFFFTQITVDTIYSVYGFTCRNKYICLNLRLNNISRQNK